MHRFGVIGVNHGHVYGITERLVNTGRAVPVKVYAREDDLAAAFLRKFPDVKRAGSEKEIIEDPAIDLVVSAAVNAERGELAARVLRAGKSFLVDKPPVTTAADVDAVEAALAEGKALYFVYWGARAHAPNLIKMKQMIHEGAIGRVVHFMGLGPHRLGKETRPAWMFSKEKYGGILVDIGSHQFELFTYLTGEDVVPGTSRVANYDNPDTPEFEDFGDAVFTGTGGTSGYVRVDWFTPPALPVFGDGRQIVVGTEGYFESRSYIDIGREESSMCGKRLFYVPAAGSPREVDLSGVDAERFEHEILDDIEQGVNRSQPHDRTVRLLRALVRIQEEAEKIA